MLNFHIITVGKLKEEYWREAEAEYVKRLLPYAKVVVTEIKEENFDDKASPDLIKKREGEKITAALAKIKTDFLIILDSQGKIFTSPKLAERLAEATSGYGTRLTFVIGGPLGLDKNILAAADLTLSLSALTFTHQMARIILLEQVYRAMMITQNRRYHY